MGDLNKNDPNQKSDSKTGKARTAGNSEKKNNTDSSHKDNSKVNEILIPDMNEDTEDSPIEPSMPDDSPKAGTQKMIATKSNAKLNIQKKALNKKLKPNKQPKGMLVYFAIEGKWKEVDPEFFS